MLACEALGCKAIAEADLLLYSSPGCLAEVMGCQNEPSQLLPTASKTLASLTANASK